MRIWKNYGLSIILFLLFFLSWIGQATFQWREYVFTQREESHPIIMEEFFDEFLRSTLENWQSEFLQLFTFVVLATYFIHKGSPQSKDGDEEMKHILKDIQKKVRKN